MSVPSARSPLAAVALSAAVLLLVGCSTSTSTPAEESSAEAMALRAAFPGGSGETLNYLQGPTAVDYVRAKLVHAPLCELDPTAEDGVTYGVVESIDVSDDLSEYTLTVRDGVEFTDGSALTSADVLYSLRAPVELGGLPFTLLPSRSFDLDAATATDERTVVLPTTAPIADGREILCQSMLAIQDDTTEFTVDTPSSGPFTIASFEAGQSTVLERNEQYYGDAPELDGIELVTIADAAARVTALQQGQVDYAAALAPAQAQTLEGTDGIAITTSELPYASYLQFTMDVAAEPFDDPRVREAIRLAVDRERIVDTVYFGLAEVGNDVPGLGFANYDDDLPQREQDVERAQALVEEAGATGVAVQLTAGPELAGMVETATLVVEDLQTIGLDASLAELPPGQLFADFPAYQALPFRAAYNPPALFEPNHVPGTLPEADALVQTARSALDADERLEASHAAQQLLWEQGNQLGVVFVPAISASSEAVSGVRELQFPDFASASVTR